ncbi:hypothetical protein Skr01_03920 [Sphaerisporangium krabiense]|uniref:Uncharacterized protein n=1 Tax=Sphaerisporangium krabiense TaxID=763782 RepID=A0A7W9DRP0_9ACTN|nr:hypothetical protein [Sphaerisporangium krabiense]MBB5628852.1 hypothetical protein [Sphaerisporangium krabiense]GII60307.1 hypothetical protein Skr01_03920 [Sphaerisporangium krabiense]
MAEALGAETRAARDAAVTVTRDPHVGQAYTDLIDRCRDAVAAGPGLDYVAHYGSGVFDFSVDAFESGEYAGRFSEPVHRVRDDHRNVTRQLISRVEDFGALLEALDSGALVRTVVQTEDAAFHCGRVRAGEYLVGATLAADRAPSMDWAVNALVTETRVVDLRLGGQNPGGVPVSELPGLDAPSVPYTRGEPGMAEVPQATLFDLWAHAVNAGDLNYAALHRGWWPVHTGDVLDDLALAPLFRNVGVRRRRELYQEVAGRLRTDVARLRQTLRRAGDSPITRLVLDVEEGAIYVHWLGAGLGDFLFGVTLLQDKVDQAELRLRRLAEALGAVAG